MWRILFFSRTNVGTQLPHVRPRTWKKPQTRHHVSLPVVTSLHLGPAPWAPLLDRVTWGWPEVHWHRHGKAHVVTCLGFFSRFEDERGVIVCPRSSWKKNKTRHIGVDPGKVIERTLRLIFSDQVYTCNTIWSRCLKGSTNNTNGNSSSTSETLNT